MRKLMMPKVETAAKLRIREQKRNSNNCENLKPQKRAINQFSNIPTSVRISGVASFERVLRIEKKRKEEWRRVKEEDILDRRWYH